MTVILSSGVLSGIADGMPVPMTTDQNTNCPVSANPSETLGNLAIVYYAEVLTPVVMALPTLLIANMPCLKA